MNRSCLLCGTLAVPASQPCPYCGLLRDGFPSQPASQLMPARAGRLAPGSGGTPTQMLPEIILAPGTTLDRERYLLLEPRSMVQWSPSMTETLWYAQEREPAIPQGRSVLIADVTLPTYRQHQEVSRGARRAFLDREPQLLNTFLEQNHTFFVFSEVLGESLQQRIDRQAFLEEREAVMLLQTLAIVLVGLSNVQPPIMHGRINPTFVTQRGGNFQLLPASVLVAGQAARFLDGEPAPAGISSAFHPGHDLFAAIRTVYAGLTGVFPAPMHGLPPVKPRISSPFAALLARGLQSHLLPGELLTELSSIVGEEARAPSRHAHARFSGPLAPASRFAGGPGASFGAEGAREPVPVLPTHAPSAGVKEPRGFPPGPPQKNPPGSLETLPPYPQAPDGLQAALWSSAVLAAEALFLLFSR